MKLITLLLKNWPVCSWTYMKIPKTQNSDIFTELLWHYYSCAAGDNYYWLSFMQFLPIFIPAEVDGKTQSTAECCRNKGWLLRDTAAEFSYCSVCDCVHVCLRWGRLRCIDFTAAFYSTLKWSGMRTKQPGKQKKQSYYYNCLRFYPPSAES